MTTETNWPDQTTRHCWDTQTNVSYPSHEEHTSFDPCHPDRVVSHGVCMRCGEVLDRKAANEVTDETIAADKAASPFFAQDDYSEIASRN